MPRFNSDGPLKSKVSHFQKTPWGILLAELPTASNGFLVLANFFHFQMGKNAPEGVQRKK